MIKRAAFIVLLACASLRAESYFGESSDFLTMGSDARSTAMGGAFTAVGEDASAPYFNGAGLAFGQKRSLTAMFSPYTQSTDYGFFSYAHPFGNNALAVSNALLSSDKFEVRDISNNLLDADGKAVQNMAFVSYARRLNTNAAVGVSARHYHQKVADYSGSGVGLDLSGRLKVGPYATVALSYLNANSPTVKLRNDDDTFKPVARLGVASGLGTKRFLLAGDLARVEGADAKFAVGGEWMASSIFALRAGYNLDRRLTAGVGLLIKMFRIDYSFEDTEFEASNRFSLTFSF